ncbi:MAG: hypothetical protein P8Z79_02935 [Sedimentisphaerales bacterium]
MTGVPIREGGRRQHFFCRPLKIRSFAREAIRRTEVNHSIQASPRDAQQAPSGFNPLNGGLVQYVVGLGQHGLEEDIQRRMRFELSPSAGHLAVCGEQSRVRRYRAIERGLDFLKRDIPESGFSIYARAYTQHKAADQ